LPAGTHWLARCHWCLRWLAYEPENPLPRRALSSTLAEDSAADAPHAAIRARLREHFAT
jgi:hypothetical protein